MRVRGTYDAARETQTVKLKDIVNNMAWDFYGVTMEDQELIAKARSKFKYHCPHWLTFEMMGPAKLLVPTLALPLFLASVPAGIAVAIGLIIVMLIPDAIEYVKTSLLREKVTVSEFPPFLNRSYCVDLTRSVYFDELYFERMELTRALSVYREFSSSGRQTSQFLYEETWGKLNALHDKMFSLNRCESDREDETAYPKARSAMGY